MKILLIILFPCFLQAQTTSYRLSILETKVAKLIADTVAKAKRIVALETLTKKLVADTILKSKKIFALETLTNTQTKQLATLTTKNTSQDALILSSTAKNTLQDARLSFLEKGDTLRALGTLKIKQLRPKYFELYIDPSVLASIKTDVRKLKKEVKAIKASK